jgi:hypothetical protein
VSLSILHFIIDEFKINYDLKTDNKVRPFIIDQILHLTAIFIAYFLVKDILITLPSGTFYDYYQDIKIILFVSLMVFFGVVIEVYRYQKIREIDKSAKLKLKPSKVLDRILVFTISYFLLLLLGVIFLDK